MLERAFAHYQASQRIELGGTSKSTVCGSVEECQQQQDSSSSAPKIVCALAAELRWQQPAAYKTTAFVVRTMASSSDERGARSAGNKGKREILDLAWKSMGKAPEAQEGKYSLKGCCTTSWSHHHIANDEILV